MKSQLTKLAAICLLFVLALPAFAREATEIRIDLRTSLTGISFNGQTTRGKVEYENEAIKRLIFEVSDIALPNGSVVGVYVNGTKIGSITLSNHGGTLLRSSAAGQTVPSVAIGSTFKVVSGSTTLLSGAF